MTSCAAVAALVALVALVGFGGGVGVGLLLERARWGRRREAEESVRRRGSSTVA